MVPELTKKGLVGYTKRGPLNSYLFLENIPSMVILFNPIYCLN